VNRQEVLKNLQAIAGEKNVRWKDVDLTVFEYDAGLNRQKPSFVVFTETADAVAGVVRFLSREGISYVARGSGTNLSGGTIPLNGGVVIELSRMNRILEIDPANMMVTVEPGVVTGKPIALDYGCIPSAVFSHPPLASVGLAEGAARNRLGNIRVYSSDFRPMKHVLAGREERALMKLVVDAATDRIVGAHMIGPDAAEIMQTLAVAVKAGLTKGQLDQTVAIHPTMAEEWVLLR